MDPTVKVGLGPMVKDQTLVRLVDEPDGTSYPESWDPVFKAWVRRGASVYDVFTGLGCTDEMLARYGLSPDGVTPLPDPEPASTD